jgi:riboflavin biosynthesis pyrimidine reductase
VAGAADRALFHELRTQADAVMAGAGTVRVERYRPITKTPELRAKREREGTRADGLAVFISGALDLDPELPILQDPGSRVAIVTRATRQLEGTRARVDYIVQAEDGTLTHAMRTLRTQHGVRSILCEGGPHLNSALLHEGLVDELFLCVSPKITGDGTQLASVEGVKLPEPAALELVALWEAEQHVFFRYRMT